MNLIYDLFPNPGGAKNTNYHPRLIPVSIIKQSQLCSFISKQCSLTSADVVGVMKSLVSNLYQFLLMGNKVRIPSLGTFYLSIAADPIDDYNANPKNIHVSKLNLIPTRGFARAMKSAVFSRRH